MSLDLRLMKIQGKATLQSHQNLHRLHVLVHAVIVVATGSEVIANSHVCIDCT